MIQAVLFQQLIPLQIELQDTPPSDPGPPGQPNASSEADWAKAETSRNVLIVDDDPDLLEVTRFVIESEGIAVQTAKNGAEALEMLRAGKRPGLVLLDLMMPVMNGWQFLDEIAKSPSLKTIPIVVLTASEPMAVPGALEVMRKPIDLGVADRGRRTSHPREGVSECSGRRCPG